MSNTDVTPTPQATPPVQVRNSRLRLILLLVVPLLLALGAGVVYLRGGRSVETDNAYVKADKLSISAEVAGPVKEVLVQENQAVTAGQPLFSLDPEPFAVAVAKAEAKMAQVRTDLAALKASYRGKQAEITVARTRSSFADKDRARQADLAAKNFIPVSKLDDSKQASELAAQQVLALEQDLNRIAQSLGGSVDLPVEHHPSWLSAKAELKQAKLNLARVEVRAPVAGTVSKLPKPGQYLSAGTTAMSLVAGGELWVEANFTETDLTFMHPGQPVKIHIDTFPDQVWQGSVDSLSPATGAEFSVIPAQNATGNWVKIAQRVPVRIRIEAKAEQPPLRAGLSADVEIATGHKRRLLGLSL
ncbi:HlyD family secretion protein [Uliginosibacterium sp. 31-16]|uniref:HlyD family secretion protein n=1 Tax=Uliginosibacterium sp. 31-16 TaxID=3068315 RepID=UPI00273D61F9|nr:HlyD family secretion protein [Uliginosibacterium sp. 31-16]MDP5239866.1 HlyD family secretion protein [Uliginosibacterium sp. 31-16]